MALLSLPFSISGDLAEALATALVKAVTTLEADIVRSLTKDVMAAALATTSISPAEGNNWFGPVSTDLFPVAVVVVAPLLFAATIGCILRQDMRRLARVWAAGLPMSLIGSFIVVKLTGTGLSFTDALSSLVQSDVAPHVGTDFLNAVTFGVSNPAWGFVGDVISLVVVAGGLAIWLELALRAAAIELAIFFMPLAFAGLVWPATAHWAKRLLEVLCALLMAKPLIVGALCLGDNAINSAAAGPSSMVTGAAILLMAAFAPMALLKLVPVVEVSAIAHLQGLSRQPFHAAERSVHRVVAAVGTAAGFGAAAGAAAGAAPPPSDGARQLLSMVGPDSGDEGHEWGPAQPPPPGSAPSASGG